MSSEDEKTEALKKIATGLILEGAIPEFIDIVEAVEVESSASVDSEEIGKDALGVYDLILKAKISVAWS